MSSALHLFVRTVHVLGMAVLLGGAVVGLVVGLLDLALYRSVDLLVATRPE